MKTPEEIKKATQCCYDEYFRCLECPYSEGKEFGTKDCGSKLAADVVAYIEAHEGKNDKP